MIEKFVYSLRLVEPAPHCVAAAVDARKFAPHVALGLGARAEIKRGRTTTDTVLGMPRNLSTVPSNHGVIENDGGRVYLQVHHQRQARQDQRQPGGTRTADGGRGQCSSWGQPTPRPWRATPLECGRVGGQR